MSQPSAEVLVHIAAPSGAADDATYRAHADACLRFEPVTRLRVHPQSISVEPDPATQHDGVNRKKTFENASHKGRDDGWIIYRKEGFKGSFDTLDMSYTSLRPSMENIEQESSDNIDASGSYYGQLEDTTCINESIEYHPLQTADGICEFDGRRVADTQLTPQLPHHEISENSFQTPPSVVPDSQTTSNPNLETTPTPPTPTPTWSAEINNTPDGPMIRAAHISISSSTDESYSPSKRRRLSPFSQDFPSALTSSFPSFNSISEVSIAAPPYSSVNSIPPSSTPAVDPPQLDSAAVSSVAIKKTLSSLPLEILSPDPIPSSTAKFTTHITPSLRKLSEFPKLSRYYNPTHETRSPRTLERGYWFLPIPVVTDSTAAIATMPQLKNGARNQSNANLDHRGGRNTKILSSANSPWSMDAFSSFWDYLTKYISQEGKAGWGVWCFCEASHSPSTVDYSSDYSDEKGQQPSNSESPVTTTLDVRIYTWGEIVFHIYLLIYIASDKRIREVRNVEWRDGGGNAVIRMN